MPHRPLVTLALLAAVLLAQAAPSARAQQAASPTLTINQIDAGAFPDLRAIVTVLDPRGVPAQGLTAQQFQAFDGNRPLNIAGVQTAQDQGLRLSVIIAIDVSGSMAGEPIDRAKQAATEFVRNLGPNDQIGVMAFNQTVTPVVALTNDRAKLTDGIAGLQAAGGTALYEAVQTSAFVASASRSPRAAVIVLSDGENDAPGSQATDQGSIAAAQGARVPVFTIGFGPTPDAPYLQGLSTATLGQYRPATSGTLSNVYADLATLLRNQYVLTIKASGTADGSDGSLQVIAFVGGTPAAAVAPYRRGIAAAAPTQPAPTAVAQETKPAASGGRGNLPLLVFAGLVAVVGLVAGGVAGVRWRRRRNLRRVQLDIVAPNQRQAREQGVPRRIGAVSQGGTAVATEAGTGRLVEKGGDGRIWEIGGGPAVIGTAPRACNVLLPPADDVAAEHARIWLRDGRYMLHHLGGMSRKTHVGGREADWVVLEPGDEIVIGRHRFVFHDDERAG